MKSVDSLETRLPILPADAEILGKELALKRHGGEIIFFNASGPIYTCNEDDEFAVRLGAAMMCEMNLVKPTVLAKALGMDRGKIYASRRRLREGGPAAVKPEKTGPRGPHKLGGEKLSEVQEMLDRGVSNYRAAKLLDITEGAIRFALGDGRLRRPSLKKESQENRTQGQSVGDEQVGPAELELSGPRARTDENEDCSGGIAVTRNDERGLARVGKILEGETRFVGAEAVAKAGILIALPALLGQGLIDVGEQTYGALRNGYFGLRSVLLTYGFMALLRIKTIEDLPSHSPGEFGAVLGLDRAPEIRTARRKLQELAQRELASQFAAELARRWAEEDPGALGFLYIDGHVRPYHGRTHVLPKTFVQSRRLCMPATTDYWVNDANAEPLFFVTAEANDGLLSILDSEVLPSIRKLAGTERRVTLVFDREGWSPDRFRSWVRLGVHVLTYRKGSYVPWPDECFSPYETTVAGDKVTYMLGQRSILMKNDKKGRFWVREVRRLCANGHQTSVITTRQDMETLEVATRMFSRWKQENFFRYMRAEFDLDHTPTTAVEPADSDRLVPNPERRDKQKQLKKANKKLGAQQREYGELAISCTEGSPPNPQKVKRMQALECSIEDLGRGCSELADEVKALPVRVPLQQIFDKQKIIKMERERKVLTDAIKMIAYRAETQLANLVGPLLPYRDDEARNFLKNIFQLPADLVPDEANRRLEVRLHSMANPRSNRALRGMCEVLNGLEVPYPGTDLKLVFEAPSGA